MSDFGDAEPEDAWHPDDPTLLLIENLQQRLDLLEGVIGQDREGDLLDRVEQRLAPWLARRGTLEQRVELRIEQLIEDIDLLRERRRG